MKNIEDIEKLEPLKCPFNHTRVCPHQLHKNNPAWCQVCVLVELGNEMHRLRVTGIQ